MKPLTIKLFDRIKYDNLFDKDRATQNYLAYMLDRTQRIFEYEGLPDTLTKRNLEIMLQGYGYVVIPKPEYLDGKIYAFSEGVYLGGAPNAYYMPTIATVSNPYLAFEKTLTIDEDCVVIPNDALYQGLVPLLSKYITILVENDITIRNAIINDRSIDIIDAPDGNAKMATRAYLKAIEDGKFAFLESSGFADKINVHSRSGQSNLLTQHIEIMQYIKASMLNDLGLNANYNMKRESLNDDEISLNDDALLPLIQDMLEQRQIGFDKVNEKFGTNIKVRFSKLWRKKEEAVENDNPDIQETETVEKTTEETEVDDNVKID